jgi:chitin disaccharide deacetylase
MPDHMKRLIVNADGFGFGPGATQGVLDAIKAGGFITSVSVNANFPEAARVRELVEKHPQISVGVHLNPVVGRPCLPPQQVPTLVDSEGFFHGPEFRRRWQKGLISTDELRAEFLTQIEYIRDMAGDALTHLDSHQNLHLNYFDLFLEVARKSNIVRMRVNASIVGLEAADSRQRWLPYLRRPQLWLAHRYRRIQMRRARRAGMKMADALVTVGHAGVGGKATTEGWQNILANLPNGTFEIYCHPAYPDETLRRWAAYVSHREDELRVLSNPSLRETAKQKGVKLISFHDI